jgi:protein SCO1/2
MDSWRRTTWLAAGLLIGLAAASPARAERQESAPPELADVGVDEHLGVRLPLELPFLRHDRRPIALGEVFNRGRPVILSLNYSNCPMLCSLQLNGLIDALRELDWTAGQQFDVVSVSIDPLETPQRARQTQQKYVQAYGRPGAGAGWTFLTGSERSIRALAEVVGFRYHYVRSRGEYAHAAVFMICTADGRISRYLYGVSFPPTTVRLALVEAGEGTIGTALDQVLLYCFHYDSTAGRYALAARKLMKAGGVLTLVVLGLLLARLSRRRAEPAPSPATSVAVGV